MMHGVGLIERFYSRPPMSWTLVSWNWLMRPMRRRQQRRRAALAAEYHLLANILRAAGKDDSARLLQRRAQKLNEAGDGETQPPWTPAP